MPGAGFRKFRTAPHSAPVGSSGSSRVDHPGMTVIVIGVESCTVYGACISKRYPRRAPPRKDKPANKKTSPGRCFLCDPCGPVIQLSSRFVEILAMWQQNRRPVRIGQHVPFKLGILPLPELLASAPPKACGLDLIVNNTFRKAGSFA
jgi:hypothetical protein